MTCQICNGPSTDKYCKKCKHIRAVYVIHKLLEKISLNEKFNKDTLTVKKIKNIEEYDLDILLENEILLKDRFNNYKWTSIDYINKYLEQHDKTKTKLTIKNNSKKDKEITIDEAITVLEKNYNITDTFDEDNLSFKLKANKKQTKEIIRKLTDKKLIKKSFYGKYIVNYQAIIKYKKKNNIKDNKIKRLNNIKQTANDSNNKKTEKKSQNKKKNTKKNKASSKTKENPKKKTRYTITKKNKEDPTKKIQHNKENINKISLSKDDKIIPTIREYINSNLIILPRNVKSTDLSLNEIYHEFTDYAKDKISQEEFDKYFHRIINTYPHIRHEKMDDKIKYNIKSRKTPQIIINNLQKETQKFTYNKNCKVQLKENTLKVSTNIKINEMPQLYNLLIYTQENIIEYNYYKKDDEIHFEITYDLNNENPDLWLKFLKSYNLQ